MEWMRRRKLGHLHIFAGRVWPRYLVQFQSRLPPDISGENKEGKKGSLWREHGERSRGIFAMALFLVPKKDPLGVN